MVYAMSVFVVCLFVCLYIFSTCAEVRSARRKVIGSLQHRKQSRARRDGMLDISEDCTKRFTGFVNFLWFFSYASSSTLYPCQWVSRSAEFRTSVALRLASLFCCNWCAGSMKSADDYINNVKFSRNKVRFRYSASIDPLIGCCRVQWCTMTFSVSKNNMGPMNNCVHLNNNTINTKYNWHIVQAIFDATNTTRERRATVYERIVHQHGLKCMFLESICNRWVKSILQPQGN